MQNRKRAAAMSRHYRLWILLCTFLLWTACFRIYAYAAGGERSGRLTIRMLNEREEPVGGGSLLLYHVADASLENGEWSYRYSADFSSMPRSLEGLGQKELLLPEYAEELVGFIRKKGIEGSVLQLSKEGGAERDGLPLGIYLVRQQKTAAGYEPLRPFCVALPAIEEGIAQYRLEAFPKLSERRIPPGGGGGEDPGPPPPPETEPVKPTVPPPPEESPGIPGEGENPKEDPNGPNGNIYGAGRDARRSGRSLGGRRLAQTGQLNWPIPVFAGAGTALLLTGWYLSWREKKREKNSIDS